MARVSIVKTTTKIGHCCEKLIPNQNTTHYTLVVLSQKEKEVCGGGEVNDDQDCGNLCSHSTTATVVPYM